MKRLRLDRWAIQLQPPRNPRLLAVQQRCPFSHEARKPHRRAQLRDRDQAQNPWQCQRRGVASRRKASSAAAAEVEEEDEVSIPAEQPRHPTPRFKPRVPNSAKLSALHARLSLPSKLPLQTLARCLVDKSADPRPDHNNEALSVLGQDLLGYYTAEWLICRYPRIPMPILFAAQYAYVGSQTLAAMRAEWGVEVVAAPGPEVDPGLLQLKRMTPGNAMADDQKTRMKDMPSARRLGSRRPNDDRDYRRGMSSRIVYDDEFGELHSGLPPESTPPYPGAPISTSQIQDGDIATSPNPEIDPDTLTPIPTAQEPEEQSETEPTTVSAASATFIRALTGALYLHAGTTPTKTFHTQHMLSRHLPLSTLFHFTHPTRDLSRLCAREGFEPPVARLISETGRLSRTPVFVVGVFSGEDKLGEGAGSSLNEGRVRAAAAAMRSWYLYSPPEEEVMVPSDAGKAGKKWKAQMVDMGEIVT